MQSLPCKRHPHISPHVTGAEAIPKGLLALLRALIWVYRCKKWVTPTELSSESRAVTALGRVLSFPRLELKMGETTQRLCLGTNENKQTPNAKEGQVLSLRWPSPPHRPSLSLMKASAYLPISLHLRPSSPSPSCHHGLVYEPLPWKDRLIEDLAQLRPAWFPFAP
eukprot:superscaffoldBa00000787_g7220